MTVTSIVSQWSHLFGALISLPCLLLIILIYSIGFSFIRMPRKTKHSLINILLLITCTITLFTTSLTFPFSLSTQNNNNHHQHHLQQPPQQQQQYRHCIITSALVHFSTLSCLLWIFLSAISMYRSLSHSAHEFSAINSSSSSSSSNNNNTKSLSTDDNEDDDLRLPDLPLRTRSIHTHSSSTCKKRTSSLTILGYYLFGYGLSTIICISCLTINFGSTYSSLSSLSSSAESFLFSSCYVPMTPGGYAVVYGPIALLFCLNLIVYLIVACILSCLGTNIVSPGGTLHDSTISLKNGLNGLNKENSIKVDLEWTYRRQLFAQIGLFILFTNLIVSMIFLVAWRPFSFVNQLSSSSSASSLFLSSPSTAAASTASLNGSFVSSPTPTTTTVITPTSSSLFNSSESIPLIVNNVTSHLIPLAVAASASASSSSSSSSSMATLQLSSPETASHLLSGNLNAFQLDQLFYGLVYSLSSFLLTFYMLILYVARRRDVRTLLTYWLKGSRNHNHHHHHHHQYHNRNRRNWLCCLSGTAPEIPLMPKVDVIRNSNSHSSGNSDHHHLAQALLQSVRESSSNNKLNIDECEITNSNHSKELAHGLVYEEIKIHDNNARLPIPYKVINNISSDLRNNLPSLIESPLINDSTSTPYHLDYHQSNHEVFINPKLNAIAKKFFEKNRRRQEQQQQQSQSKDKQHWRNDLDAKVHSITSTFGNGNHRSEIPVTASIFSNRPRLSFDNGYHSNGFPKDNRNNTSSASCVGVPITTRGGGNEISDLITRLQSVGKIGSSTNCTSTTMESTGPAPSLSYSKAKSDIVCCNPSSSFLSKWQGPRSNPPPLPPLPSRKEMMSISQSTSSQSSASTVRQTRRLNFNGQPPPPPTGKESPATTTFQDDLTVNNITGEDNDLMSGLRVKLSNRKLPAIISPPPLPSNLHRSLVKSSSSIPGALDDRDQQQSEVMSVCCGSEVMSTVSVPWTCYSKRTAPILSPTNHGETDRFPLNSSSSYHRHHCHSHSHHHHHRSHHKRSSRSHRNTSHCNRCWDVYFCDICDGCSKSPSTRRVEASKDHPPAGHLSSRSANCHLHHHPHGSSSSPVNSSSLIKKDSSSSPLDVNVLSSNTSSLPPINHSSSNCHPRKSGSTVSSNGVERRRRRRRRSSQCKNRSSQGSTGYSNHSHSHGPCKHLPRSTSVSEYRSCHYCYTKNYSSSDTQ